MTPSIRACQHFSSKRSNRWVSAALPIAFGAEACDKAVRIYSADWADAAVALNGALGAWKGE